MEVENNIVRDKIICIPYFIEKLGILLKYKKNDKFNLVKPEIDKFISVLECDILEHETPLEALKRVLKIEYGIMLKPDVEVEILLPIFMSTNSSVSCHICILPLMEHQYEEFVPTGVTDIKKKKEENILLPTKRINDIIVYDITTRYVIDLYKQHYSLF
jgi:hypothetical protein